MKKRSLKKTMLAYALTTFIFMSVTMLLFLFYHYDTTLQYVQSSYEGLSTHLQAQFAASVESIQKTATTASYSSAIQACLFTKDPEEYFKNRHSAGNIVTLLSDATVYTDSIFLVSNRDRTLYNTGAAITTFRKSWGYFLNDTLTAENPKGFELIRDGSGNLQLWYYAPFFYSIKGATDRTQHGVCAVLCDLSSLTGELELSKDFNTGIALMYRGAIVSSNRTLSAQELSILNQVKIGLGSAPLSFERHLAKIVDLSLEGWQFVFITADTTIAHQAVRLGMSSLFVVIIFIAITAAFVISISLLTTRPVNSILAAMRVLRERNWDTRIADSPVKEFSELVNGINETLDLMREASRQEAESKDRLYQARIAHNKAKLDAYRMQINPHFLFNTLECVRSMASLYDAEPVENMIESLSYMFRYSLHSDNYVPLSEEIKHLQHYINVMNMRYNNCYHLSFRLQEPALLSRPVCSMILQPLAENSIKHGFIKKDRTHRMLLQAKLLTDGKLLLRFTDNGQGIKPEKLEKIRARLSGSPADIPQGSIGLSNIHQRLLLTSKSCTGLSIRSKEGCYTSIAFVLEDGIPLQL